MCKHTKLELSGRIENFNGHRYVNIYNCKICGTSIIFTEKSGLKKIDYKYFM